MSNLQDISSLKAKYAFEPPQSIYKSLYQTEKHRIENALTEMQFELHHFGSTAINGVGGKGIIDIYLETDVEEMTNVSELLESKLGYEFRESGGNSDRLFHQIEIDGRRYHVHVTYKGYDDLVRCLAFRDFLNENQFLAEEYSDIKKAASEKAMLKNTKEDMKKIYMETKSPVISKINKLVDNYILEKDK